MSDDTFINYTHPDQQIDRANRRRVAQYIGTHYRNRSGPVSRRAAEERARQNLLPARTIGEQQQHGRGEPAIGSTQDEAFTILLPELIRSVPRDRSGIRVDPFNAFPIGNTDATAPAVDYCKEMLLKT